MHYSFGIRGKKKKSFGSFTLLAAPGSNRVFLLPSKFMFDNVGDLCMWAVDDSEDRSMPVDLQYRGDQFFSPHICTAMGRGIERTRCALS